MKRLLVVVDYQNDFVNGALGFEGAELLDENIAKKVRKYGEDEQGKVYYTLDTHLENYLETREGKALPVEHCIEETEGWEVFGETKEALTEVNATKLIKFTFGVSPAVFYSNDSTFPSAFEVESVEIIGLVTNMCVISNVAVFQAKYPNAQIIVDASLCDSFDKELHNKTLDVLEGLQVKVLNRE